MRWLILRTINICLIFFLKLNIFYRGINTDVQFYISICETLLKLFGSEREPLVRLPRCRSVRSICTLNRRFRENNLFSLQTQFGSEWEPKVPLSQCSSVRFGSLLTFPKHFLFGSSRSSRTSNSM